MKSNYRKQFIDYSSVSKVIGSNLKKNLINKIIEVSKIKKSNLVLDLGCGTGGDAKYLCNQTGARVIGIDYSNYMLAKASRRILAFKLNLEQSLPFTPNSIDTIYSLFTLNLINNRLHFFQEIKRLLKRKGNFCTTVNTREHIQSRFINDYFPSLENIEINRNIFLPKLKKIISEAGFKSIEVSLIRERIRKIDEHYYNRLKSGIFSSILLLENEEKKQGFLKLREKINRYHEINNYPEERVKRYLVNVYKR